MNFKNAWRGVFALLAVFITWQTLTPDPDTTEPSIAIARFIAELLFHDQRFADKVAHFLAYAALGGSAAFGELRIAGRRLFAAIALAAYGCALEFLQGLGGVRVAEFADAAANSLGVVASFASVLFIESLNMRKRHA